VLALRRELGTLAAESIEDFNFTYVPGALERRATTNAAAPEQPVENVEVWNGIDALKEQGFEPLKGLRIGLIVNHTGIDRERNPTIDLLKNAPGVELIRLFSPEHGIRGVLDDKVGDTVDEKTGLPVISLYPAVPARAPGQSEADFELMALRARKPSPEHLRDLDALVFDIQDIGCRFYTYISTLGMAMEAAGEAGIQLFVLDRANPINGLTMDGPVQNRHLSFIGFHPIPVRHGMTVGELAQMFNAERDFKTDLTVIPMKHWTRGLWFDQTGLPWIDPSPNMRSLTQATLYPGIGLVEYNPVSVGRGTDTPFELVGAPYIEDARLAEELNAAGLPGVRFVPVRFTPNASVFQGKECGGVNILLTDRDRCDVVAVGVLIAQTLHRLYPEEFDLDRFQKLVGHHPTVKAIRAGKSLEEIRETWSIDLDEFKERRKPHLLYP
jgi:uncharacterized protein YbbC (DUF1343 family)